MFTLIGADGKPCASEVPGTLGGNRRGRLYGRLGCRSALRAIQRGGYVEHRVFFADQTTAIAEFLVVVVGGTESDGPDLAGDGYHVRRAADDLQRRGTVESFGNLHQRRSVCANQRPGVR